jgi:hypothetical protein
MPPTATATATAPLRAPRRTRDAVASGVPLASGAPFPIERPTAASWREQALSRIAELRFVRDSFGADIDPLATRTIDDHLAEAAAAAKGGWRWPRNMLASLTGSAVDRVISHLDAVEAEILRIAPAEYLRGQVPSLLAHVQLHLEANDPRRIRVETIAERVDAEDAAERERELATSQAGTPRPAWRRRIGGPGGAEAGGLRRTLDGSDREAVVAAVRAASSESRWRVARLRSFRNVLIFTSLVLTLGALGVALLGWQNPKALPLCFTGANVVCPTATTAGPAAEQRGTTGEQTAGGHAATDRIMRAEASGWDITIIEVVGLLAAAVAAATAVRNVQGTSTPYGLPVALAVLKLPTGALTALLGLLLMRGGFVPGLSALDSPGQIIAWAIVFGYAQQLLTRFVDTQAQSVLKGAAGDARELTPSPTAQDRRTGVEPLFVPAGAYRARSASASSATSSRG